MGHSISEKYLSGENINEYFEALATKIQESGIGQHKILVVGGAAMALKYQDGRSTVDIDICFREQNNLYACCKLVAEEYELPDDWINADVMHSDSFSYVLFDKAELYKTYGDVLEVFVSEDLDLYCMKLVSFRPKDVQDMETLASSLKNIGIRKEDVIENFVRLYGNEYLLRNDDRKIRFMEMQFKL
ncbi:MAG: hypothetical protein IJ075_06005 [Lachnospiraceae bacterium]|nr:hypothetical protein [Lachnospiraceae bacterium]MBQ9607471.1 hypothetical protein [Lachnospiraceae bacterium]MBR1523172.1 hypothetical protein [Lachnospiraceae bacterium]